VKAPSLAATLASICVVVIGAGEAHGSGDSLPRMRRYRAPGVAAQAIPICSGPQLSYFGGPIVQTPVIVPVFWNTHVNATLQANIQLFYGDVTHSSFWSWLEEYDTVPRTPGTAQAILSGSAGPGVTISAQTCASGTAPCSLTDAQLQAELVRQIGLGVLPAPSLDCTGNTSTIYMVHFPPNISLGFPGGPNSCVSGGFCAYHFTGTFGTAKTPLLYAALMDVFTGPCANGCGSNNTALENATDVASHELAEAVTDPDVGLLTQANAFPGGWDDTDASCGEIGDICDDGSPGDTITVNGRSWVVQELWSNRQNKCVSSGPVSPVCAGTTVTGCRACSCGDNGNACGGPEPVCETARGNVLFGACEPCTATSGTCGGGKTCMQSSIPVQDDVCAAVPAVPVPPWASGVAAAGLLLVGAGAVVRRKRQAPR
jgi:hypothetical protein